MASAQGGSTTRRSSSNRTAKKHQDPEVSPARWAGVALVIAAIVGAIFLAVISPSDPSRPSQTGAEVAEVQSTSLDPSPSASAVEAAVPVVAPEIVIPDDGKVTGEYEFAVTVAVPDDRTVPRKLLDLDIYNNGVHQETAQKPKPGTEVKVDGVRLTPGQNIITAQLSSLGGPGPASEPVTVTLDEDLPELQILTPSNKFETYEDSVTVEVASEVDASVTIHNHANDHDPDVRIGPSGSESAVIRLRRGKNRIEATSVDQAGQNQSREIVVTRVDGRPRVALKVPKAVKPPEEIKIVAAVTDAKKKPIADAEVYFTLTAPNQSTIEDNASTNAKGRAVWEVPVAGSSSPAEQLLLGVTVIAPSGEKKVLSKTIDLR